MRNQYCAAAISHPPYACTKEQQRSWLEAASLSFSIAELLYAALIFGAARLLWHRFRHQGNKVSPSNTNGAKTTTIFQNRTYMASGDVNNPPAAADLMRGDDQEEIIKRLAEVVVELRQELQSTNARLGHLEHEQGELQSST